MTRAAARCWRILFLAQNLVSKGFAKNLDELSPG